MTLKHNLSWFLQKILHTPPVFNIYNSKKVSWAENEPIRMISEGSRDTEDWSNGC